MFFRVLPLGFLFGCMACTNNNISPSNTLTTIVGAPIQSLNPLFATDANSQHVNELTQASLLKISDKLLPEPYLAQSMRVISGTVLEFELHKNCTFPDGKPITSKDVEKSWQFFIDPKNNSAFAEQFKKIIKMEIINDWKFRFITEKPVASLPTDLIALKIMQLSGDDREAKAPNITGAGPYTVSALNSNEITLEKRKLASCFPSGVLEKIKIKAIRDDLSRFLKLKNGEVDIILNELNYRKAETVEKDPSMNLATIKSEGIGYNYIGINQSNKKLQDVRVREAIALSLDFPQIIKYKNRGMSSPSRNLLADTNYFANLQIPVIHRDLEKARQLLDEAGYFNGKNNKPPLKITLKTTTAMTSIENARVITAQAREAGIEIEHQSFEWGIFYSDIKSGNAELYLLRWVGVTDPGIYFEVFHSGEITRNNRTKYINPEMDKWIELGQSTLDPAKRKLAFDQVQKIARKDLPYIGMWYPMNVAVVRKELTNVVLHPTGSWLNFAYIGKK